MSSIYLHHKIDEMSQSLKNLLQDHPKKWEHMVEPFFINCGYSQLFIKWKILFKKFFFKPHSANLIRDSVEILFVNLKLSSFLSTPYHAVYCDIDPQHQ